MSYSGAEAVIPPKSNSKTQRPYDRAACKERSMIERCLMGWKDARLIDQLSTKCGGIVLAWVLLFGAKQWI